MRSYAPVGHGSTHNLSRLLNEPNPGCSPGALGTAGHQLTPTVVENFMMVASPQLHQPYEVHCIFRSFPRQTIVPAAWLCAAWRNTVCLAIPTFSMKLSSRFELLSPSHQFQPGWARHTG